MAQNSQNTETRAEKIANEAPQAGPETGIAAPSQNEALEHSVDGVTTRHDALDAGVPMLAGSPEEQQGPEDALGPGPKRGDYTKRIGPENYQPHTVVAVPNAGPDEPKFKLVPQRGYADDIGDAPGQKGGVETI